MNVVAAIRRTKLNSIKPHIKTTRTNRLRRYITRVALTPAVGLAAIALIITAFATSSALGSSDNKKGAGPSSSVATDEPSQTTEAQAAPHTEAGLHSTTETDISQGSHSSVKIEGRSSTSISIKSKTDSSSTSVQASPEVVVNGQAYEIPENGRMRQDIRDDNSRTRIRTDVDAESGSSSISISTNISNTEDSQ